MNSLVSVIIPTFNGEKFIVEAIESVLDQSYKNFEILVVDDGSTDNTISVLKTFKGKVQILQKPNGGPASARNLGIRHSKGDFIALLDHDDFWLQDKLILQMQKFAENPEVAMVFSDAYIFDDNSQTDVTNYFSIQRPARGFVFPQLLMRNFIPNLTVVAKKTVFQEFGLFDTSGRAASTDDYYKWLEVSLHYQVEFIDRPLAKFRLHESNFSHNLERTIKEDFYIINQIFKKFPQLTSSYQALKKKRFADLYYRLSRLHQKAQDYESAIDNAKLSISQDILFWKAWLLLAYCRIHAHRSPNKK